MIRYALGIKVQLKRALTRPDLRGFWRGRDCMHEGCATTAAHCATLKRVPWYERPRFRDMNQTQVRAELSKHLERWTREESAE